MTDTTRAPAPASWPVLVWPFVAMDNAATARRALLFSAIMLLIKAAITAVSVAWTMTHMAEIRAMMDAAMAVKAAGMPPEQAAMASSMGATMLKFGMYFTIFLAGLYLVAALVQWRKPTGWIPLVLALFAALGVVFTLISLPKVMSGQSPTPAWLTYASFIVALVCLGVFINAFRAHRFIADNPRAA